MSGKGTTKRTMMLRNLARGRAPGRCSKARAGAAGAAGRRAHACMGAWVHGCMGAWALRAGTGAPAGRRRHQNSAGTWTNGTANTFVNTSVGPSGWANITVFAYNASGTGTQSAGSVSDSVQAPAAPATIVSYGESVHA